MTHFVARARRRALDHVLLALAALAALASCNKAPEPDRSGGPPPVTSTPMARPGVRTTVDVPLNKPPAQISWDVPPAWPKVDSPSRMRMATYKVPRAAGDAEDGELTVAQAGGSVDQNVTRWAGQFAAKPESVKRQERKVGALNATLVEIHGPYTGMAMPGAPAAEAKPGYALLGAIVETVPPTFFKLVGPEKTVVASRHDFEVLVDSLRVK